VLFKRAISLGLLAIAGISFACSDGGGAAQQPQPTLAVAEVTVNLTNWAIEPSSANVPAGKVAFVAVHPEEHGDHGSTTAGATHQLVVARLDPGKPAGTSQFGAPVLNLSGIGIGETKTGEAMLEPGVYELGCLVVEQVDGQSVNHYQQGMFTTITVE